MASPTGLSESIAAIAQNVHPVGNGGELLADAIVQVVSDTALLAVADLQNLAFQAFSFGDVARDTLHLGLLANLFHQAGADFQALALPLSIAEIPLRRGQFCAVGHLSQPLCDGLALFFGHKLNQVFAQDVFAMTVQQLFSDLVDGRDAARQSWVKTMSLAFSKRFS